MNIDEQLAYLTKGCVDVVRVAELRARLERFEKTGKPMIVKVGFDPTAPDLHLGHTVLIRKMKHFQDLGHTVVYRRRRRSPRLSAIRPAGRKRVRR